jgi:hypothetical protein
MAGIGDPESVFTISRWLGLNENPDGDTGLKAGEAAEMTNFRITQDGNLQLRPGFKTIHSSRIWSGAVRGIWNGFVYGTQYTVFAAGGGLYKYDFETNTATSILGAGLTLSDADVFFFGYSGRLYAINGHEYIEWDGQSPAKNVEGYRPLVAVAVGPTGGGTALEQVNKLCGLRRVWVSPDGSATVFVLPERGIASVDYVRDRATGQPVSFTYSAEDGTVTFASAPDVGTDTIEIGYTHPVSFRDEALAMRFAEIYNGATDNRVFLYGDGSNRAIYSGLDYDGRERADYFPDMNVLDVGTANTPITALVRHYSQLAVYKSDSSYSVRYGTLGLEGGALTSAFYITPANRALGNEAPGQALLVENSPRTLASSAVYEWRNYSSYSANLTSDERQAHNISSRVHATLSKLDLTLARTYNDRDGREYYILLDGVAVVNNYASDAWYIYRGFDFTHLFTVSGELYGCLPSGDLAHISRRYQNDDGAAIDALWRSGSMSFARDWRKKYSPYLFVTMKPEVRSHLLASIRTNRKSDFERKALVSGLAGFFDASFRHFSFGTNRQPQSKRIRLKAKKFAYYQLLFESCEDWSTATALSASVRLRYASDVR